MHGWEIGVFVSVKAEFGTIMCRLPDLHSIDYATAGVVEIHIFRLQCVDTNSMQLSFGVGLVTICDFIVETEELWKSNLIYVIVYTTDHNQCIIAGIDTFHRGASL